MKTLRIINKHKNKLNTSFLILKVDSIGHEAHKVVNLVSFKLDYVLTSHHLLLTSYFKLTLFSHFLYLHN